MAKVDKEFNLKDWEWIAVHFPPSERESMAKVAWIICCKCTPEKISQHKIDPRIVIPLCAIELLDEKDISNFQKFAKEKKVDTYHRILAESKIKQGNSNRVKQEFITGLINSINPRIKWKSLFETLDIDLQFTLLYRLLKCRPPTHNDWQNIFLDVKDEFLSVLYLSLTIIFAILFLLIVFIELDLLLKFISDRSLVYFYFPWYIRFIFPPFSAVLILILIQNNRLSHLSFKDTFRRLQFYLLIIVKFLYLILYSFYLGILFAILFGDIYAIHMIPTIEIRKNILLRIFRLILNPDILFFSMFLLLFIYSIANISISVWSIIIIFSISFISWIYTKLWIYTKRINDKATNPLKNIFKYDSFRNT